jgi:hypothetical protein
MIDSHTLKNILITLNKYFTSNSLISLLLTCKTLSNKNVLITYYSRFNDDNKNNFTHFNDFINLIKTLI